MIPARLRITNAEPTALRTGGTLWFLAGVVLALALALSFAAGLAFGGQTAHASARMDSGFAGLDTCLAPADCEAPAGNLQSWRDGSAAIPDAQPSGSAQIGEHESAAQRSAIDAEDDVIWSTTMTVGRCDIASVPCLGYITGGEPMTGNLQDVAFTHHGVQYIVTALYQPVVIGKPNHLFLHLNQAVSDDLILQVGANRFPLWEAMTLGTRGNVYHWYREEPLDWNEGSSVFVALSDSDIPDHVDWSLVRHIERETE